MEREAIDDPESTSATITTSSSSTHQVEQSEKDTFEPRYSIPSYEALTGGRSSAWATVVSAFLLQLTGFGYSSAFGVFQDFYVREYLTRSTSSQISWIGSSQSFLMLAMGALAGRLFDKGYCYHLVTAGSIIHVLSLWLLSFAQPDRYYQILLAQGIGIGIGSGLIYTPCIAVIAQHFPSPTARARTMGVAVSGVSLGGLIHPILLNALLHRGDTGDLDDVRGAFKLATRASAGLITGLTLIAVLLLRTKYPKESATSETEKGAQDNVQDMTPTKLKDLIKKFSTDWPYVCFVFGMTLYELVFLFPLYYLQLYAIKHDIDSDFAFYSISILNGVSLIGRLAPGFFTRSLGVGNMLLLSTAGATVLMFCMLAVHTVAGVAVYATLYGFFSGAFITLMNPMLALLAEGPSEIGARMGMCFAITGFGSLTGTPIAGALLTSRFIWWRPIVFNGCLCIIGFLLFAACRVLLGKRRGSGWVI